MAGHWRAHGACRLTAGMPTAQTALSVMSLATSAVPLGARNATLTDLAALLRNQQARKVNVVAPASAIHARHGQLVVDGTAPVLGDNCVTLTTGTFCAPKAGRCVRAGPEQAFHCLLAIVLR